MVHAAQEEEEDKKSQEAHKYKYIQLKRDKTIQQTKLAQYRCPQLVTHPTTNRTQRKTNVLSEENESLKDGEGRLTDPRVEQEILQSHQIVNITLPTSWTISDKSSSSCSISRTWQRQRQS